MWENEETKYPLEGFRKTSGNGRYSSLENDGCEWNKLVRGEDKVLYGGAADTNPSRCGRGNRL